MNNLRYALRQLRKAPAFTLTALATVAICLGANLAIFAVINSILLRPLPFPQSDRLVTIFNTYPKAGVERDGSSVTNYYERRGNLPAFSSLSIFRDGSEVVGETGAAEQTEIMRVSPDFFATLGVNLAMGRTFTEEEATIAKGKGNGVAIVTDAHNAAVEEDNPEAKMMAEAGFRSLVRPLHAEHVRSIRPTLLLMQAGVFFLLLIGAVNLVNLLLIRASGRAKEMAIRRSMGASCVHVVRQVIIETVLLTFVGGLLGLAVGAWGIRLFEVLGADRLPLGARIAFDGWLASIGLAGAVVLGVVIAVPIAWFNLSSHLAHALQSESRTGTISRAAQRLRHGFIVAQIALAFVLLAGAALLGLSLKKVMSVSPGFRADHVLTGQVTGDYFTALGIPLREGRFLTSADSQRADRVCVVAEDFARRYWPNGGALGQRVFQGSDSDDAKLFTIVGVVGAVKQAELTEPEGQGAVYLPFMDSCGFNIFIVTRTSQRPQAFAEAL